MRRVLLVGNFEDTVDEGDLERLFSSYGRVKQVTIWTELSLEPRRFGLVKMGNEDQAKRTIECLNGRRWRNRRLQVIFERDM